jgi:hypothetical protein
MRRRRAFSQFLVAGGVLLLGLAGFGLYRFKSFVDNDPRLCAQCHRASTEFSLWTKGSHRSVACQRCHHSTPEQSLAMLRAFVAGKMPKGNDGHAPVEVGACASCHLSHDPHWPQVGGSRGHRIHFEEKKIACVVCHAAGVHGFEPAEASCQRCHGQHAVRESGMQKLHCFACHDFLSRDVGLRPTRRDCLRCHRAEGVMPARFSDSAPMQFACGACHKPHARPPEPEHVACAGCHRQLQRAGLHARAGHQKCQDCHRAHLWEAGNRKACQKCHQVATVHGEGQACTACHKFRGAPPPFYPSAY